MHITFICTGNTCRSPMAEGIAKKIIAEKYSDSGITVSSAGVSASNGSAPSEKSVQVCEEIGVDISNYRSNSVSHDLLESTDLFAVMTKSHADILKFYGIPEDKIVVLGDGIPDPFSGSVMIYRKCRDIIADAVDELLAKYAK